MKTFFRIKYVLLIMTSQLFISANGQYIKLVEFSGDNGSSPMGSLVLSDSIIYGTTQVGGINDVGVIFKINTDGTGYKKIHEFDITQGGISGSSLILEESTLYGMTTVGGPIESDSGMIYKIRTDSSGFQILQQFNGSNGSFPLLCSPILKDNMLYGMTTGGGIYNLGIVFKVDTNGTGYTVLHSFNYDSGYSPRGSLAISGETLYGATNAGGSNYYGTLFSLKTDGTGYKVLFDYNENTGGDPGTPCLIGNTLFGNTDKGIYKIGIDGDDFRWLLDFNTDHFIGIGTYGCRINIYDTVIYGLTSYGGTNSDGLAFRLDTSGHNLQVLYDFNSADGNYPAGSLIVSGKTLYGITSGGGKYNKGVIYKLILCKDTTIEQDTKIAMNGKYELPGGVIVDEAGTYIDTLTSYYGCDSIIVTHITQLNCSDTLIQVDTSITEGGFYELPGGEVINIAGTYTDSLTCVKGCDSIIVTNLSIISGIIDHDKINMVLVYPNPADKYIIINTSLDNYNVSICNIMGKVLMYKEFESGTSKLNISDLKDGVYYIKINHSDRNEIFKLLKINYRL